MIAGVDVFGGYGVIDWTRVAESGCRFAYVKCAEGNELARNDSQFRRNVEQCKAQGIYVGAYFFPYPLPPSDAHKGRSPAEQAERFFEVSKGCGMQPGELPPCVDAEWPEVGDWGRWGCSPQQISDWLKTHCERVTELFGRKPVIYTYPFWWRTISASADVSWAAEYPLWIANYTWLQAGPPAETMRPIVPAPWDDYLFWQHSAKGSLVRVPGIGVCPVDRDVFRGDLDGLRKLALIDPDADTQPEVVPAVRPSTLQSKTIVDWAIVRPKVPFGNDDDDEPDDAA